MSPLGSMHMSREIERIFERSNDFILTIDGVPYTVAEEDGSINYYKLMKTISGQIRVVKAPLKTSRYERNEKTKKNFATLGELLDQVQDIALVKVIGEVMAINLVTQSFLDNMKLFKEGKNPRDADGNNLLEPFLKKTMQANIDLFRIYSSNQIKGRRSRMKYFSDYVPVVSQLSDFFNPIYNYGSFDAFMNSKEYFPSGIVSEENSTLRGGRLATVVLSSAEHGMFTTYATKSDLKNFIGVYLHTVTPQIVHFLQQMFYTMVTDVKLINERVYHVDRFGDVVDPEDDPSAEIKYAVLEYMRHIFRVYTTQEITTIYSRIREENLI